MTTKAEILAPLNEEQKDVVLNYKGKISLEAIPGSGKTRTLVHCIQYMIKDGVRPSKILAFTFTKKAANELKERVRDAIGPDADHVTISTYHSFCGRILRNCASYAGRTSNFSIYDEDDKKKVLNEIIKEYFKRLGTEAIRYNVIDSYIGRFKQDNLSPSEAKIAAQKSNTSYMKACAFIYESYENKMRELNAFDFDDLPFFAYRITKNNPEVLDSVSSLYEYVLADENQDSNHQNLDFILLLGSKSENIIMVGDTDQSIYKFRGADVANVIDVIHAEGFKTKFLSTNYRSTKNIVEASNALIKHNSERIQKVPSSNNEEGEKLDFVYTKNEATEAEYICRKIERLKRKKPNLKYKDIAVLTRTQYQIDKLEETFLMYHIPFNSKGKVPFYCRLEIKDILGYLKFAYNTEDLVSFSRIINVPRRGIGETSLKKLIQELSITPINDIINNDDLDVKLKQLGLSKKGQNGFKELISIIIDIRKKIENKEKPSEIIKYIIDKIDYNKYLEEGVKVDSTLDDKKANVEELIFLSSTYESLQEFLTNATLDDSQIDEKALDNDKVNIMTMHSSKGLEFDTVFIAGAHDENTPFVRSHDEPEEIEEERRLFYVAMTRAKKKLIITIPRVVTGYMNIQKYVAPSRFLREIPDRYSTKFKY